MRGTEQLKAGKIDFSYLVKVYGNPVSPDQGFNKNRLRIRDRAYGKIPI